jgi:hypothetical protein
MRLQISGATLQNKFFPRIGVSAAQTLAWKVHLATKPIFVKVRM